MTWGRVELGTGAVGHEAVPAEAEPPGAFAAVVGDEAGHPLLAAHAARRRPAMRLSDAVEPRRLFHSELFGDLLHASGFEYGIAIGVRTERREAVVVGLGRSEREFSERDRDVLDLVCPGLEGALRATEARGRLVRALAADPPRGTAVVLLDRYGEIELSSGDAERWFAEHFGAPEHPGWLPGPVAEWLALPPRPPLVAERDDRLLTISLVPGDPHALLLEEEVASVRTGALDRFGLTPRETEVLRAAEAMDDEADIAWELSSAFTPSGSGSRAWRPSSACARPPTPSPARCARARRHRAVARRSHPGPAGGPRSWWLLRRELGSLCVDRRSCGTAEGASLAVVRRVLCWAGRTRASAPCLTRSSSVRRPMVVERPPYTFAR